MNISSATYRTLPDGGYHGVFSPFWTSTQRLVVDKHDRPRVFHDAWQAEAMAWRECMKFEYERLQSLRLDPSQIEPTPQFWEARSRLGKKRFAERALKEAMKEATT